MGPMGRGGPGAVMAAIEKPKDFNKTIKTLLGYLKPYRISVAIVIIFAIASTVFAIVDPKILGVMTNTIVYGYGSGQAYDRIVERLPPGVSIPPGTTGEQVLAQMPASIRDTLTANQ